MKFVKNIQRRGTSIKTDIKLFLEYFKSGVKGLVTKRIADFASRKPAIVPQDFWVNHVTATFIETLRWWLEQDMQQPPALIAEYFLQSV